MIEYGEDLAKIRQILHNKTFNNGKNNNRWKVNLTKNW
jgi:hypothetical protein